MGNVFVYSLDDLLKCIADTILYLDSHYFIIVAGHQVSIVDAGLTAMIINAILDLILEPLAEAGGKASRMPNQGGD